MTFADTFISEFSKLAARNEPTVQDAYWHDGKMRYKPSGIGRLLGFGRGYDEAQRQHQASPGNFADVSDILDRYRLAGGHSDAGSSAVQDIMDRVEMKKAQGA